MIERARRRSRFWCQPRRRRSKVSGTEAAAPRGSRTRGRLRGAPRRDAARAGAASTPPGGRSQQQRGGGPQAQSHGEARLSDPHRRAAPPGVGEERRGGGRTELGPPATPRPGNGYQPHRPPGGGGGKRRNSCNVGGGGGGFKHPAFKRRRRVNSDSDSVLPSSFLLEGSIFDPLNLNSLLDEEVSPHSMQRPPKSSPLPAKGRDPVDSLIPKDITDPLSLNTCTDEAQVVLASPLKTGRKRHRHWGQQQKQKQSTGGNDSHSVLPTAPLTPSLPHSMGRAPHSSSGIGAKTGTSPNPMKSTQPSTAGMRSCHPFHLPCRVPQAPFQPLQLPQLPLHPHLHPHDIANVAGLPASQRQGLGVEARVPR
nr:7SK snRNA methylphosphate capping enzyme-like [Camelus dromedarius]